MHVPDFLQHANAARPVRCAVLGAGYFGGSLIAQATHVPHLKVAAVADADLGDVQRAFERTGIAAEGVAVCQSKAGARHALEFGRCVATTDPSILFDQPLDVIVEATGSPESAADHAEQAIAHGLHVAMVTKEADVAVGPYLKYLADRAGVVYTAVEGDQHGLLINQVRWARSIGLQAICAGKLLDQELIVHPDGSSLTHKSRRLEIPGSDQGFFAPSGTTPSSELLAGRAAALGHVAGAKPWDLCELTIVANGTALPPDVPQTHCPALWTTEIPGVLRHRDQGGILAGDGVVDAVQVLRAPHEASLGGGVFVVVRAATDHLQRIFRDKGMICSPDGATALLLRPHHLLGIEAVYSVLAAALLKQPTGAIDYRPRFDVAYRTRRPLRTGQIIEGDHSLALTACILRASGAEPQAPVPAPLTYQQRVTRDMPAGTLLTYELIERPTDSALWTLRERLEAHFQLRPHAPLT